MDHEGRALYSTADPALEARKFRLIASVEPRPAVVDRLQVSEKEGEKHARARAGGENERKRERRGESERSGSERERALNCRDASRVAILRAR